VAEAVSVYKYMANFYGMIHSTVKISTDTREYSDLHEVNSAPTKSFVISLDIIIADLSTVHLIFDIFSWSVESMYRK